MPTPEQLARQQIDALLTPAGRAVQDDTACNPSAASGISASELPFACESTGTQAAFATLA
ncbi:MAG: hypothetical protein KF891_22755 [Rhizobacter sp.]|nr:hypothetical protein [Rhizobacter sp.]